MSFLLTLMLSVVQPQYKSPYLNQRAFERKIIATERRVHNRQVLRQNSSGTGVRVVRLPNGRIEAGGPMFKVTLRRR